MTSTPFRKVSIEANMRPRSSSWRSSNRVASRERKAVDWLWSSTFIRLIARHTLLQKAEAVCVDRADEKPRESVQRLSAKSVLDTVRDSVLQLLRRPIGECEGDDRLRRRALGEQRNDSLRHYLGLA